MNTSEAAAPSGADPHLILPTTRLSRFSTRILDAMGELAHWTWAVLAVVIFINVILRYALRSNFIWAEELQWHLYGFGIMIAIAYGISADIHVRVDVLAARFSPIVKARIELIGFALFVLPLTLILFYYAWPFVFSAFQRGEASSSPGGLGQRWLIKSVLILAFGLMVLATLGRLTQLIRFFRENRRQETP